MRTSASSATLARLRDEAAGLEARLLRTFCHAQRSDVPAGSVWNWRALGEHHPLPTRLLGWTYSPYIALHFPTANVDAYGHRRRLDDRLRPRPPARARERCATKGEPATERVPFAGLDGLPRRLARLHAPNGRVSFGDVLLGLAPGAPPSPPPEFSVTRKV
jgi:hypothetical protein